MKRSFFAVLDKPDSGLAFGLEKGAVRIFFFSKIFLPKFVEIIVAIIDVRSIVIEGGRSLIKRGYLHIFLFVFITGVRVSKSVGHSFLIVVLINLPAVFIVIKIIHIVLELQSGAVDLFAKALPPGTATGTIRTAVTGRPVQL